MKVQRKSEERQVIRFVVDRDTAELIREAAYGDGFSVSQWIRMTLHAELQKSGAIAKGVSHGFGMLR